MPTNPKVPQPTLCTLPSRLIAARKNLIKTGLYLGEGSIHDNVHWVRQGRADRLAVKPLAATPTCSDSGKSSDDSSKYPSPPPDEPPELASLCAIAHISNQDFWLTSDAGYRGPSSVWGDLARVKPSCTLEEPDMQPVRGDFKAVMDNLRKLQDAVATSGFSPESRKGLLQGGNGGQRFKVKHVL